MNFKMALNSIASMINLWKRSWQAGFEWGLELLFPCLCLVCQKPDQWLCAACLKQLGQIPRYISSQELYRKRKVPRAFSRRIQGVWYWWDYQDPRVRQVIHSYKFGQIKGLGLVFQPMFGRFLAGFPDIEIICVAPDRRRLRARGFDHIREMVPENLVSENVRLQRIKNTSPQSQTSGFRERWKNLRGVFELEVKTCCQSAARRTKTETSFLIDDVLTSGATAASAAQALEERTTGKIYLAVLARG